jgi:hypothetical protein
LTPARLRGSVATLKNTAFCKGLRRPHRPQVLPKVNVGFDFPRLPQESTLAVAAGVRVT